MTAPLAHWTGTIAAPDYGFEEPSAITIRCCDSLADIVAAVRAALSRPDDEQVCHGPLQKCRAPVWSCRGELAGVQHHRHVASVIIVNGILLW